MATDYEALAKPASKLDLVLMSAAIAKVLENLLRAEAASLAGDHMVQREAIIASLTNMRAVLNSITDMAGETEDNG